MSRVVKAALEGIPYHVTQYDNNPENVFFEEKTVRSGLDNIQVSMD